MFFFFRGGCVAIEPLLICFSVRNIIFGGLTGITSLQNYLENLNFKILSLNFKNYLFLVFAMILNVCPLPEKADCPQTALEFQPIPLLKLL